MTQSTPPAASPVAVTATVPGRRFDAVPLVLVPLLALVALPLVGSTSSWITLTVAGLAMGMMEFGLAMIAANLAFVSATTFESLLRPFTFRTPDSPDILSGTPSDHP